MATNSLSGGAKRQPQRVPRHRCDDGGIRLLTDLHKSNKFIMLDPRLRQVSPRAAPPNARSEPTSDQAMLTADPTNRREFPEFPSVKTRTVILKFMKFVAQTVGITSQLLNY